MGGQKDNEYPSTAFDSVEEKDILRSLRTCMVCLLFARGRSGAGSAGQAVSKGREDECSRCIPFIYVEVPYRELDAGQIVW